MVRVFRNIKEAVTLQAAAGKSGRKPQEADLSVIKNAAMVSHKGLIQWIGPEKKLPVHFKKAKPQVDLKKATVIPAFIECHTHSLFAGDRTHEFELRNQGVSYQEISKQGGGILSTMRATRQATAKQLSTLLDQRLLKFLKQGVTTVEVKSGYGLSLKDEIKILKSINASQVLRTVTTFLGPHARPPEADSYDQYINDVITNMLPEIARLKLCCRADIFVDEGFFTVEHLRKYTAAAQTLGFKLAIHSEQLSCTGASALAANHGAISVDHVVQISKDDIRKLADSQVTAVLLPAADLYLHMKYPPARQMIDQGVRVAISTDFNPGTSPTQDLSLVGFLARSEMKMTLPETLVAYTLNAAYALGLQSHLGSLEVSKDCDFVALETDWRDLFYSVGHHPVASVWSQGQRRQRN